jgi:hypothetical protein
MSSVLLDDFKANKIYGTLAMLLVSPPFDEDMLTFKVSDTGIRRLLLMISHSLYSPVYCSTDSIPSSP